jgi:hypothetical protein
MHSSSDNRPSNGYGSENVNYSLVGWGPDHWILIALKLLAARIRGLHFSFNYTFFDNPYFTLMKSKFL